MREFCTDECESELSGTGCLSVFGTAPGKVATHRPEFLIISPPKTGSTWLADNIRRHPGVFIPGVKEVKYFCTQFRRLDWNWYLDQFVGGVGRIKGEASPSYAILPTERIRMLRRLMPDLKLVFLMRDPLGRAWSHSRHTHQYREANFAAIEPGTASAAHWRENFVHDWTAASGDYLGQLRRWLSVFPREQVYVGFYEAIAERPVELLRDVFAFLGVDPHVDLSSFPVYERILAGPPGTLTPDLRRFLHRQLHSRTVELAGFLKAQFGLEPGPAWAATLAPPDDPLPPEPMRAFAREADDGYLASVLEEEERFPTFRAPIVIDYLGYDFVVYRARLFAIDRTTDCVNLATLDAEEERDLEARGICLSAPTLADLKERVMRWVAEQSAKNARRQAAELSQARERIGALEAGLAEAIDAVRAMQADAVRLSPREHRLVERVRRVGRGLTRLERRVRGIRPRRWVRSALARVWSLFGL